MTHQDNFKTLQVKRGLIAEYMDNWQNKNLYFLTLLLPFLSD